MVGPKHPGAGRGLALRDNAGSGIAVLVVDDEPMVLRATSHALQAAGYDVTGCADGEEAVNLLASRAFAVVVSDIDMPRLSGVELLKALREREIDVPVILMTGYPTLDSAVRAVEHGAFRYMMKPVELPELREAVARAASSRAASGVQRRGEMDVPPSLPARSMAERARIAAGAVLGDRYRLVRALGEGGMSQVWEACHVGTGRAVALKLLRTSLNARPEMRRRVLREARAAGSVDHPNVVDVLDLFELADGTPVMAMELLRGETLGRHLASTGALSLADAAHLLLPVVSAVGTAHARGVVHRDLKPDNIFLAAPSEGGATSVKVLDFGIAKLLDAEPRDGSLVTATGALLGTPGYMSPEQAFCEADVDHRADVWAVGAILYEMLAGVRAIEADNIGTMVKVLMVDGIVPLSRRMPHLPAAVLRLVDRTLSRARDDRPVDLREVHAELARHADVEAPAFGPPSARMPASPLSAPTPTSDVPLAHALTEPGASDGGEQR